MPTYLIEYRCDTSRGSGAVEKLWGVHSSTGFRLYTPCIAPYPPVGPEYPNMSTKATRRVFVLLKSQSVTIEQSFGSPTTQMKRTRLAGSPVTPIAYSSVQAEPKTCMQASIISWQGPRPVYARESGLFRIIRLMSDFLAWWMTWLDNTGQVEATVFIEPTAARPFLRLFGQLPYCFWAAPRSRLSLSRQGLDSNYELK